MTTINVNQDALLSMTANFHGFIVEGLYSNGMMLHAARTKKEKETESERMYRLKAALVTLGLTATIKKLASLNGQIEVKLD
jgi:hypothetical protein